MSWVVAEQQRLIAHAVDCTRGRAVLLSRILGGVVCLHGSDEQ